MHTKKFAALRTNPICLLLSDELLHSNRLDALQICDCAHSVLHSIALVQMLHRSTRELAARGAEPLPSRCKVFAVLDGAIDAGLRFVGIVTPTSRTWIAVAKMSTTQCTVYSARRD